MCDSLVKKREIELRNKVICRFCFSLDYRNLKNIYSPKNRLISTSLPIAIVIKQCLSLEVSANESMPSFVCRECRLYFDYFYQFKEMCKNADEYLRRYILNGKWYSDKDSPKVPPEFLKVKKKPNSLQHLKTIVDQQTTIEIESDDDDIEIISTLEAHQPNDRETVIITEPMIDEEPATENESAVVMKTEMTDPVLEGAADGNLALATEILDVNDAPVANVFPRPKCELTFPLSQLLEIHLESHEHEQTAHCSYCDKSFCSKLDLQKHLLIHDKRSLNQSSLLHCNENTHTSNPKLICGFCMKPFFLMSEMSNHIKLHHDRILTIHCKKCGKSFNTQYGLNRHKHRNNCIDTIFQCRYCNKSYLSSTKLAKHLKTHAGAPQYPCKLCPNSFWRRSDLLQHMLSHNSHWKNDCDQTLSSRDNLVAQSAVHDTQTFTCPLCQDAFESVETMEEHVKQHVENEVFACESCDMYYMSAERLQQHTDAVHAEKTVDCNQNQQENPQTEVRNEQTIIKAGDRDNRETYAQLEAISFGKKSEDNIKEEPREKESSIIVKEETNWQIQCLKNNPLNMDASNTIDDDRIIDYVNLMEENEVTDECPAAKVPEVSGRLTAPQRSEPICSKSENESLVTSQCDDVNTTSDERVISVNDKEEIEVTDECPPIKLRKDNYGNIVVASTPKSIGNKSVGKFPKKSAAPIAASKTLQESFQDALREQPKYLSVKKFARLPNCSNISTATESAAETSLRESSPNKQANSNTSTDTMKKVLLTPEGGRIPADEQIAEVMIGDKRIKVRRIKMSKEKATSMARKGLIQSKDGLNILLKNRTTLFNKVSDKADQD